MTVLTTRGLTVHRGGRPVLGGIDLCIHPGEFVGLLGPNGAGKTTLLRAALGLLPCGGTSSLAALPTLERARRAAFMPQGREIAWPLSVERVVALGRAAHPAGARDGQIVAKALALLNLTEFRERPATDLSGGEQARVLIARMIAQDTPLMIADEPIAGLDPAAQIQVMEVFSGIAARGGAVLASLHDLGLAARHCTRLVLLHAGHIAAEGRAETVLSPENLAQVFGITAFTAQTSQGMVFQPLSVLPRPPSR
ncbi:ABC transporter ATP-binding protein [Haematobacter massiliensis]|uniref:ABC transporter n=1 Tax=Haematobacter massiliensis TaxID=195105 RepID=A0A086Y811_9RHOB|nr:ABC transporter ATP-binding protein [Haematobacter massiliensis]KFI30411.1 ABC transporter [Haematobacter massiliensis]OWJ70448.1 ABC transporter ATP-binding protein [Haematobacter massiliensis]OWJ87410.1 ABC transporter ATP-binding protein [Haematobacter massiliensis]QBJ24864.1 ABC transporter ATP-binding protein [Haematobacter massiliensis]